MAIMQSCNSRQLCVLGGHAKASRWDVVAHQSSHFKSDHRVVCAGRLVPDALSRVMSSDWSADIVIKLSASAVTWAVLCLGTIVNLYFVLLMGHVPEKLIAPADPKKELNWTEYRSKSNGCPCSAMHCQQRLSAVHMSQQYSLYCITS